MTKDIEFIPASSDAELLVPMPKPAKVYLPQWYKDILPPKEPKFHPSKPGVVLNKSIKQCIPFFDAYTHGYIQETWTDIYIQAEKQEDGTDVVTYHFPVGPEIMSHREKDTGFKVSPAYYPYEFLWAHQWIPKCPDGYSMLYTSPLNHFDLPFRSLDAVIDSDKYYHEYTGQSPFYIYKGFSGVIPAGTPMFQMIPIKREDWQSHSSKYDEQVNKLRTFELRKYLFRNYKRLFWQKKMFS